MSAYDPPTNPSLSVFTPQYWYADQASETLTYAKGDARYLKKAGGTVTGNTTFSNNVTMSKDLKVDTNTLVVDSTNNRVGVCTTSPSVALDVTGACKISGNLAVATDDLYVDTANHRVGINNTSPTTDLDVTGACKISGNLAVDTNTLFVDSANNCVGIVKSSPSYPLDVTGNCNLSTGSAYKINGTNVVSASAIGGSSISGTFSGLTIAGDVAVNTNVLKVDTTNNRVAVNETSPSNTLSVTNTGDTGGHTIAHFYSSATTAGNYNQINLGVNGGEYNNTFIRFKYEGSADSTSGLQIGGAGHSAWFAIRNDGKIGISTLSPSYTLHLNTDSAGKPNGGSWANSSSDIRLKTDVVNADLDICYSNVKNIPLIRYKYIDGLYTDEQIKDKHVLGWSAQDVEQYYPKAVNKREDHGLSDCRDLDATQLQNALYGAVQKLMSIVEELQTRVSALESK